MAQLSRGAVLVIGTAVTVAFIGAAAVAVHTAGSSATDASSPSARSTAPAATITAETSPSSLTGSAALSAPEHLALTAAILATRPVTDRGVGTCNGTSASVAGAFRCQWGTFVEDPCFAVAARTVDCVESPWAAVDRLTIAAALPAADSPQRPPFWAVELAGGYRCVAVNTAVTPSFPEPSFSFGCGGGAVATIDPSNQSLAQYRASKGARVQLIAVTTLWTAFSSET